MCVHVYIFFVWGIQGVTIWHILLRCCSVTLCQVLQSITTLLAELCCISLFYVPPSVTPHCCSDKFDAAICIAVLHHLATKGMIRIVYIYCVLCITFLYVCIVCLIFFCMFLLDRRRSVIEEIVRILRPGTGIYGYTDMLGLMHSPYIATSHPFCLIQYIFLLLNMSNTIFYRRCCHDTGVGSGTRR